MILPSDYDTIKRLTGGDDVYDQYDQVIAPMDSIKPLKKRAGWSDEKVKKYNKERIHSIINSGWDLLITDEAHRVAGSSGEVARYKLENLLSQPSPYLPLLSPHRITENRAVPAAGAVAGCRGLPERQIHREEAGRSLPDPDRESEAMSLDMEEEIAELKRIIAMAKQAGFRRPDVKAETLTDTLDAL